MNIGYIIIENKNIRTNSLYKKTLHCVEYNIHKLFNMVWKKKYDREKFYINSLNNISKSKLIRLLRKNNIEKIVTQKQININYPKVKEIFVIKYFLNDIIKYVNDKFKIENSEIYLCVNDYTEENIELIRDMATKYKVINVVTENTKFRNVEKQLEKEEIYITVSTNKRLALKKAEIVINIDFNTFKKFNINRQMKIINLVENVVLPRGFDGYIIDSIILNSRKVMKVFSDYENFDKSILITSELLKIDNYNKIKEKIIKDKIYVEKCM